jgi:hypothetical protein
MSVGDDVAQPCRHPRGLSPASLAQQGTILFLPRNEYGDMGALR